MQLNESFVSKMTIMTITDLVLPLQLIVQTTIVVLFGCNLLSVAIHFSPSSSVYMMVLCQQTSCFHYCIDQSCFCD